MPFRSIQKALSIAQSGDVIKVQPGTYNENIRLKSRISLIGSGANNTILTADKDNIITGYNIYGVVIEGFTLDGKDTAQRGLHVDCVGVANRRQPLVIFRNNIVKNFLDAGASGINTNVIVDNNTIFNAKSGIKMPSSISTITNNNISNVTDGIEVANGWGVIENNIIQNAYSNAIFCYEINQNRIQGNIIINAGKGIVCDRSSPIIKDNYIIGSTECGIYCFAQEKFFSNPRIRGNTIAENRRYGVFIGSGLRADIGREEDLGNNSIYGNGEFDIYSEVSSKIMAIGNWWGNDLVNTPKIKGNVDYRFPLKEQPINYRISLERYTQLKNIDEKSIVVKEEKPVTFSKYMGSSTLIINSDPIEAYVYIDGVEMGKTPCILDIKSDLNKRKALEIRISKDGYEIKHSKIQLRSGETAIWKNIQLSKYELPKNDNSEAVNKVLPDEIISTDGATMILIPEGEFLMGSDDGCEDEKPVHEVYLDAFYIDKCEVTNAQYKKFMDATGYKAPALWDDSRFNASNQPVVGVSWYDAKAYAEWAGKRLPTEAEWEKSARGGLIGCKYPNGNSISNNDANIRGIGGNDIWLYTSPVGQFAPNGYGLYDMAGNVREWCSDWVDWDINRQGLTHYYAKSPVRNPTGPSSGVFRAYRGGSFENGPADNIGLRVAQRDGDDPNGCWASVGFRCVMDISTVHQ